MTKFQCTEAEILFGLEGNLEDASDDETAAFTAGIHFAEWMFDRKAALSVEADDAAVDEFACALKEKLAAARAKGRSGWETCPLAELSRMLREHVEKGDPRDVANFCMFLWKLGHGIAPRAEEWGVNDWGFKAAALGEPPAAADKGSET